MLILENLWNTETKRKAKIINSKAKEYFRVPYLSISLLCIFINYTYAYVYQNILDWGWYHFIHDSKV